MSFSKYGLTVLSITLTRYLGDDFWNGFLFHRKEKSWERFMTCRVKEVSIYQICEFDYRKYNDNNTGNSVTPRFFQTKH